MKKIATILLVALALFFFTMAWAAADAFHKNVILTGIAADEPWILFERNLTQKQYMTQRTDAVCVTPDGDLTGNVLCVGGVDQGGGQYGVSVIGDGSSSYDLTQGTFNIFNDGSRPLLVMDNGGGAFSIGGSGCTGSVCFDSPDGTYGWTFNGLVDVMTYDPILGLRIQKDTPGLVEVLTTIDPVVTGVTTDNPTGTSCTGLEQGTMIVYDPIPTGQPSRAFICLFSSNDVLEWAPFATGN